MTMLKAALGSRSGSPHWELICVNPVMGRAEQPCHAPDEAFVFPLALCAACPMLCFASIHQAAGFLLLGEDAIGKHSSNVLPMGEFDQSGTWTNRGLWHHHHGRQQIKRMKLSQMENILKVAVSICSPLKGRSKMPAICYQLWEWV